MPLIKESVSIDRPVTAVFQLVADTTRHRDWQADITDAHYTENKLRVGVMMTQNRSSYALGWRLDLNADVTDYVPNRLIAYKGVLGRFPASGRIEFESSGATTTVIERVDVRMGFLYAIFSPFVSGAMKRRTRQALNGLKATAESARTT